MDEDDQHAAALFVGLNGSTHHWGVIAMEGFFIAVMLLSQIIGATVLLLAPVAGVIFFAWYLGRMLERRSG